MGRVGSESLGSGQNRVRSIQINRIKLSRVGSAIWTGLSDQAWAHRLGYRPVHEPGRPNQTGSRLVRGRFLVDRIGSTEALYTVAGNRPVTARKSHSRPSEAENITEAKLHGAARRRGTRKIREVEIWYPPNFPTVPQIKWRLGSASGGQN
ncbi:hypothetical protein V6N13_060782 [Hibiscus sabdariffa]